MLSTSNFLINSAQVRLFLLRMVIETICQYAVGLNGGANDLRISNMLFSKKWILSVLLKKKTSQLFQYNLPQKFLWKDFHLIILAGMFSTFSSFVLSEAISLILLLGLFNLKRVVINIYFERCGRYDRIFNKVIYSGTPLTGDKVSIKPIGIFSIL